MTSVQAMSYALGPEAFLASIAASRDTLGRRPMRLLDIVAQVRRLIGGEGYAVIGGLAQILWARKTHTDDLDVCLTAADLDAAHRRLEGGSEAEGWTLPQTPDHARESDDVIDVAHLLFEGSVVDLISFQNAELTAAIIESAHEVERLEKIRFVRPELLLVTHLLRPGPRAAIAAVELVLARREHGGMDLAESERWATLLGRRERFDRTIARADAFSLE
jgi:hypothetical protein